MGGTTKSAPSSQTLSFAGGADVRLVGGNEDADEAREG